MANAEVKRRNFMVCPITLRGYDRDVDDKGADANIMDRMNSDQRHNEASKRARSLCGRPYSCVCAESDLA